uniref:BZIP domain-containing protein n=1 Tax=Parascaris equorum TaxID=6256 RepID=A0A914SAI5_PAREQ
RRRDKNNIASQRSRRKRQEKFQALKEEEIGLKKRNTELLATVGDLERQGCWLRCWLLLGIRHVAAIVPNMTISGFMQRSQYPTMQVAISFGVRTDVTETGKRDANSRRIARQV